MKDEADLVRLDLGALPVIQVVLKVTVTGAKLQFAQQRRIILHDVQCVEDISAALQKGDRGGE